MTEEEPPKLPPKLDVLDLTLGAVQHLWSNRGPHCVLALVVVAPYALMGALGLLDPLFAATTAGAVPEGYLTSAALMLAWGVIWNTPAMVLWYRMFLLGPDQMLKLPPAEFFARGARLIGYSILFGLMLVAVAALVMLVILVLFSSANLGALQQGPLMAVVMVAALILGGRLCLTFTAVALGLRLPFQASWARTRGHGFTISAAFLLSVLVATLAASVAHGLISAALFGVGSGASESAMPSHWLFGVDLLLAPVSYAGTALAAAISAAAFWRLVGRPSEGVDVTV